jgi:hypothetical protein
MRTVKIKIASGLAAAVVLTAVLLVASPAQACPLDQASTTGCPEATAQINDGGVEVSAEQQKPGSGTPGYGSGASHTPRVIPPPREYPFPLPGEPGYRDYYTITDPVRLADLVNFKPAPGTSHMEPNGWMVVGLDTNFYATVQTQVQTGELLGQQASVRFTPARYRWNYGDGHGANLGTKGAPWAALGVHEFDRTATSHVYSKPGAYDINLTIYFSAEYKYAGGNWIPVAGMLPLPTNPLHATAGDAKTVLVNRDCNAHPGGPGC